MFDGNLTYFAIKFNYFWLGLGKQSWKERPKRAEGGGNISMIEPYETN